MTNIIVGTAGHIDHGKTSLVRALTGIDADRLAEEKRRGITIDLGFAHLQLAEDLRLGFVDVPGHERFVRNMLAGAGGIDLVLLVIAADESIKPQTREHFDICRLLGVKAGIVALTRCDLAGPEITELARAEAEDFVRGSFLESAPVMAVSSVTGEGLAELRTALETLARNVTPKPVSGCFRMPVDRAFTMRGFGTVVTGTVISGELHRGAEAQLYPTDRVLRVRGLQVHGEAAEIARAGQRTAVNLADVECGEIARGMVLSEPGRFRPVTVCDARLSLLPSARGLTNRAPVHFHTGSAAVEARVRLLESQPVLTPGESAWAQLVFREPVFLLPGDRFIIRSFSPVVTIGGGTIVDISGFRYRAGIDAAGRLGALAGGPASQVDRLITESAYGLRMGTLVALTGHRDPPIPAGSETAGDWVIGSAAARSLRERLVAETGSFHQENPLLSGIPRQELKGRVAAGAAQEIFDVLVEKAQELTADGEVVHLRGHQPNLRQDETHARDTISAAFRSAGLAAPALGDVLASAGIDPSRAKSVLQLLLREGVLVRISSELVLHKDSLAALYESMASRRGTRFSISDFKQWTGVSRKYAIPLLEYLDRERLTRRDGEARVVAG